MNEVKHELAHNELIRITNPNARGTIFYTLDGRDPRDSGGTAAATAHSRVQDNTDKKVKFTATQVVKARVKYNDEWSALQEATFVIKDENFSGLCISEIHYYPEDSETIDGNEYEFIELFNPGSNSRTVYLRMHQQSGR